MKHKPAYISKQDDKMIGYKGMAKKLCPNDIYNRKKYLLHKAAHNGGWEISLKPLRSLWWKPKYTFCSDCDRLNNSVGEGIDSNWSTINYRYHGNNNKCSHDFAYMIMSAWSNHRVLDCNGNLSGCSKRILRSYTRALINWWDKCINNYEDCIEKQN